MMSDIFQNTTLMIVLALAFMSIALGLIFKLLVGSLQKNRDIEKRLSDQTHESHSQANSSATLHMLEKLGDNISLPDKDNITRIRHELAHAGYYDIRSVKIFYAIRLISVISPLILIGIFWGELATLMSANMVITLALVLTLMGVFGPSFFLRRKSAKRTQNSKEGFPDMMDLLVACIEAGLSMDASLLRVSDELGARYKPLKINLDLMNRELRAGQTRHVAMNTFAERLGLEEAKALAVMLRQAEEMGTGLGKALRTFSDDMRNKRMMVAEEKAMALSAKLTVPLILFIFPTLMIILLVPAGVRITEGFGAS